MREVNGRNSSYNTLMRNYSLLVPYPLKPEQINTTDPSDEPMSENDWVYVLYNPLSKQTKIGRTTNLSNRMRSLRSQSGIDYKLLIAIDLESGYDENSKILEGFLHNHYEDYRNIGEWFTLSLRDILSIRNLFWFIEGQDIEDNVKETFTDLKELA